jgi:hypothetical protein
MQDAAWHGGLKGGILSQGRLLKGLAMEDEIPVILTGGAQ